MPISCVGLITLTARHKLDIHADDSVGLNTDGLYQGAADETIGSGNYIVGETIGLQIFEHFEHGHVEALAIGHPLETVGRLGSVVLDIGIELSERHAGVGLGCCLGMNHVEMVGQGFPSTHEVADGLCCLSHILGSLVAIGGIVEDTMFEEVVLEVGGIELTDEGSVHVEGGNTVFHADEVGRFRVGNIGPP